MFSWESKVSILNLNPRALYVYRYIRVLSMENRQSFVSCVHLFGERSDVPRHSPAADTPAGLIDIELYPHQKTLLQAILDVEDARILKIRTLGVTAQLYQNPKHGTIAETRALVISDQFGSGKTIVILSLILLRPIPRAYPTHINQLINPTGSATTLNGAAAVWTHAPTTSAFKHEIVRRFTGRGALIKPNLIVVGSSVLVQWREAIATFTSLSVLTIGDYYDLVKFYALYREGKLGGYDIVLLKNGYVTGNFKLEGEDPAMTPTYRSLVSVIYKMTRLDVWSRVIYDDFDTINIPPGAPMIHSLFSLFISATTKADLSVKEPEITYTSITSALEDRPVPLTRITADSVLFTTFNLRNEVDYVDESINIPRAEIWLYVYNNQDDNYINLIGAMGNEADIIAEMLNGDAIATAAEALGIVSTSVADIFQRMLDKKYTKYLHDQHVLNTIDRFREYIKTLKPHPEGRLHSLVEQDSMRSLIAKKQVPTTDFYSVALMRLCDELTVEWRAAKERDGVVIDRVISNVRESMCQICRLEREYGDMDMFIVRCCGLIVCSDCGVRGNRIMKRYDATLGREIMSGKCSNCSAVVYPSRDLIFVDKSFDLGKLLGANVDELEAPTVAPVSATSRQYDAINNPKLRALMAIIAGQTAEGKRAYNIKIPRLIEGRVDRPQKAGQPRKVLVFANYDETLELIQNTFKEYKVNYLRLHGSYRDKADTIKQFRVSGQVLLINSQQQCAGINIEFATDIVYFHKIIDKNIMAQGAGRAQRIGREHNLQIHVLTYTNETQH